MNFSNEKIVGKVIEVNNDDILPNRFQPRKYFDEEETLELAESIKEHGILQPIVVRQVGDKYEIIAGERRYKANILAGNDTIPAIVSNLNDKESSEIAVIENIQRQDLTPIEEAISYKRIIDMGYVTQEELARKIGKSQSAIANKIRLLKLSDDVQDALMAKQISERHARSLLQLDSLTKQNELLKKIIDERLTVRKTDEEIKKMNNNEINNNQNNMINNPAQGNNFNFGMGMNSINQNPTAVETPVVEAQPTQNIEMPSQEVAPTPNIDVSPIMGVPVNSFSNSPSVPVVDKVSSTPVQPMETPVPETNDTPINSDMNIFNSTMETPVMNEQPSVPVVEEIPSTQVQPVETPEPETNDTPVNSDMNIFNPTMETPVVSEQPSVPVVDEVPSTPIQPTTSSEISLDSPNNVPTVEDTPIQNIDIPNVSESVIPTINPSNDISIEDNSVPSFMPEQPVENNFSSPVVDLSQNTINEEPTNDIPLNSSIETPIEQTPDPIIVTNNETQYDPIMPEQPSGEPTLDFKTIINLIRQCSSTIEKCGYKIDTEEYDLDGKYQVTFVIEK